LFRCVQEALTNAMRHGKATRMNIDLREEQGAPNGSKAPAGKVRLTIQDNGAGIAPGASMGIGMTAMRERVGGLGGTASIDSAPGRGTTVTMVVPLEPRKSEMAAATKVMEGRVK
jgi:two-component system sensor histidine kinase UhpB